MRKAQLFTLAVLLLFANNVSFGGAKNDDEELLKVRRSVWIKWFENDQEALKKLAPRKIRSSSAQANRGSNIKQIS